MLEFDLIKYGPHFKMYKTMEVESLRCFKRKVRFGDKGEDFINMKRLEMVQKLVENEETVVVSEYMKHHFIGESIKKKIMITELVNKEEDFKKFKKIRKTYGNLTKYILYMYYCYTTEINEDSIGYIVSRLFLCAEILSELLYPLSGPINYIEELSNKTISLGITKYNNNYMDAIANYDRIMLFDSPLTFNIDEANSVAKNILISLERENK